jgi:hypothetical protein
MAVADIILNAVHARQTGLAMSDWGFKESAREISQENLLDVTKKSRYNRLTFGRVQQHLKEKLQ